MTDGLKINSINMFVNKFEETGDVIDLDSLKESFRLDEGENGFYKLSLYQKKVFGTETINDNYNRPPIGPIERGLYCTFCGNEGPDDHYESCDFPEQNSLNLTMEGFNNYIMKDQNYKGDYLDFKNKFINGQLTQTNLNEILLNPDEISVVNGRFDLDSNKNILTNVSFLGIYKKRGPQKLASKTTTTQFLNNLIISYEESGIKTSVRISKNGLINLINIPNESDKKDYIISELIKRINETDSVNLDEFNRVSGSDYEEYKKIEALSYVHSTTAQFRIDSMKRETEINFQEFDSLISPFNSNGEVISSDYTVVEKSTGGDNIIKFGDIKIIEWEYSLGRLTRSEVMTKEYIKAVSVPAPGLKLTAIFNKYGTVVMTISLCSNKQIIKGLCGDVITPITNELFEPFVEQFNELFNKDENILLKKTLGNVPGTLKSEFNTVTGYAPSGKICRLTRTRDAGDTTYKEGMRPEPYSWSGNCPDPNYQSQKPEGVQDSDGFWYPCCEAKSKESIEKMKRYLLNGFPLNKEQAEKLNIIDGVDMGSGILLPDSNVPGASAEVYIDGRLQDVTVVKKLGKKSNEYQVKLQNGKIETIKGTDFKRDSRVFPGLKDFNREQLLSCIIKNLNKNNNLIDLQTGNVIKNNRSEFNEKFSSDNYNTFINLVGSTNKDYLTYSTVSKLKESQYYLFKTQSDSYSFYLVLSPMGNFYISSEYNYLESEISENFRDTIVLFGYLRFNDVEFKKEFNVMDIVYFNQSLDSLSFNDRYSRLLDIQTTILSSIIDEIIVIKDFYVDIISGSYETEKDTKLIFVKDECCNYISWGDKDIFEDTIVLQILSKNRQTITFGYDSRPLRNDIGVSFLSNFTFNKRDIPEELRVNDYFNVKINRNVDGQIVPNRKISIIDKSDKLLSYEKTMEILSFKFSPITTDLFSDQDEWEIPNETLSFDGEKLIAI